MPTTRGKEHDRRPGDILAEIRRCVDEGAKEVTLLGQNVNSFGYGIGDRYAFSKAAAGACGDIEGWSVCVSRRLIRRRSPTTDRGDGRDAERHAPAAHAVAVGLRQDPACDASLLPFRQVPGYPGRKVREAMPDAQISTDIIVGFPWRDGRGFRGDDGCGASGEVPVGVHIEYSPRPGTPAVLKWNMVPA